MAGQQNYIQPDVSRELWRSPVTARLNLFAKQGFPIEVLFLFGECDARCPNGAGRCDNPKCGTAIDHGYAPFLGF
jgi:hypothetical protein